MAWEVTSKAHNDKPFFVTSLRTAIIGAEKNHDAMLQAVSIVVNLFQHGGESLRSLNHFDFNGHINTGQMHEMFLAGLSYRHGFLLNSMELSGLVHFPSITFVNLRKLQVAKLEVNAGASLSLENEGSLIGTYMYAGELNEVRIPKNERRSTHIIGGPGYGKSTVQEHLIVDDILNGHGVAVIDPHGDLALSVLELIPKKYIDKTIYIDFADERWIPVWNPLAITDGVDKGDATGDFLHAIQSFITTTGWGDRLEYILKQVIFSVLHLPEATILDVINILRRKKGHLEKYKEMILSIIDSENTKEFWLYDFDNYPKDAFSPPINKLDKLMANRNVSYMLSNPENRLDFRKIMDDGNIFIVNLSRLSRSIQSILGCFIISLFQLNALVRKESRRRFDIHIDEVHRFAVSNSLESFIEEARKFNVTGSFSHQRNSQFDHRKVDAFSSTGASIIFKVNNRDASHFSRNLPGKIKVSDLTGLSQYEAFIRIGDEAIKINTLPPKKAQDTNFKEQIIALSHSRYYLPVNEIKEAIKPNRYGEPLVCSTRGVKRPGHLKSVKEVQFDEF